MSKCIYGRCRWWARFEDRLGEGCTHNDLYDENGDYVYELLADVEDGWCPFGVGQQHKKIKIEMWARYHNEEGVYHIGLIRACNGDLCRIDDYWVKTSDIKKTADKLEDLLEVGDIVHYDRPDYIDKKEIEEITKTNIKLTKNFIKLGVRQPPFAIELHENRVIQRI